MADRFLRHYAEELDALRARAARFARAHPKIAGRLRLAPDTSDDPHVERLVQSFAFIAARVRQKLDDELPELTDTVLEALYPHHLAPIPSMTLVAFAPAAGQTEVQTLPRFSEIAAEPVAGEVCRFRTARAVAVAPIRLADARLESQPLDAPRVPGVDPAACLKLTIAPQSAERTALPDRIRFHIRAPWRQALAIYELVVHRTVAIAVARHADDAGAQVLPADALSPVGFEPDEAMLPYTPSSAPGYRLLTEFFALPEAFLGFEVSGIAPPAGETVTLYLYLSQARPELERQVSADSFALHVTPVVNLFRQRAEPIVVDGIRPEHPLVPDVRRHDTREVYSVEAVGFTDDAGASVPTAPLFADVGAGRDGADVPVLWQIARRFDPDDRSSDVAIAFVDGAGRPLARRRGVAGVDTLCLNRDLPARLPFGGGHPQMRLATPFEGVGAVACLAPPTPALRLEDADGRRWRLVSHLSLNHLSLGDGNGAALKEILKLYAVRDATETRLMVDAIGGVSARRATARMPGGAVVSGTDVDITFKSSQIDAPAAYLFATVLSRFLGLYTSLNSFVRLSVRLSDRTDTLATFPPRAGQRPLL